MLVVPWHSKQQRVMVTARAVAAPSAGCSECNNKKMNNSWREQENQQQQWWWKQYGALSTKMAAATAVVATLARTWQ